MRERLKMSSKNPLRHRPPYICPWRNEKGCLHVSQSAKEHKAHMWEVHEKALYYKREKIWDMERMKIN